MSGVKVLKVTVGPLATNCYLIYDVKTLECVIVDPGFESSKILERVTRYNLKVKGIIATHCHFDHVGVVEELREELGVDFYAHRREVEVLKYSKRIAETWFKLKTWNPPMPDVLIGGDEAVKIGSLEFETMHTPGHTPGSICLLFQERIFTGDTLFKDSIGRTDLEGGDHLLMIDSLKKLASLPDNLIVHPGHGPETLLGLEKRTNPYFTLITQPS